jgi:alkanesulfonate monooxygenase SsuD/methylene tetrahydromethanopterin reductase-like flavin-dependent oxidoreductase (luciferase family)
MPGADREREWERVKLGMELEWDYYGPFGFALVLAEPGDNFTMSTKITAEILAEKEVLIFGTPDEVAEKLLKVKEQAGYEDFNITTWFELGGFSSEEIEEQMHYFAEEVMPTMSRACGGQLRNPEVSVDFMPRMAQAQTVPA